MIIINSRQIPGHQIPGPRKLNNEHKFGIIFNTRPLASLGVLLSSHPQPSKTRIIYIKVSLSYHINSTLNIPVICAGLKIPVSFIIVLYIFLPTRRGHQEVQTPVKEHTWI